MVTYVIPAWALQSTFLPPYTRRDSVTEVLHGVPITDPYRWLEDQNAAETREWIDRQTAHTRRVMASVEGLPGLQQRLEQLTRVDRLSTPVVREGRCFLHKRLATQEHPVFCVREGRDEVDRVLIDPHRLSDDLSATYTVLDISGDGRCVVYGLRQGGEDELCLRLLDVNTGSDLPDELPRERYLAASLSPDASALYYSIYRKGSCCLCFHSPGDPVTADLVLFGEEYGPGVGIGGFVSGNGRWLVVVVSYGAGGKRSEVYVQDLAAGGPIEGVATGIDAFFWPEVADDVMYLHTDWNAPWGRILGLDLNGVRSLGCAQEVVPQGDGVIDSLSLAGDRLALRVLTQAESRIRLYATDGTLAAEIRGPCVGSLSALAGLWGQDEAYYTFSSYHVPETIYRYSVGSGESAVWHSPTIPFAGANQTTELEWASSRDGTRVPLFVCRPKCLSRDGSHPALLTGYGGFSVPMAPGFEARCAAWVERGGVFAVACLRGGSEFGQEWHEAGTRERKQNVFDDFVAASEYLVAAGYTRPERLAISGGSNGGLLVGAVVTQRPDLYRAALCGYPLLDMIRYHRFLQAAFWVPEYGSADDPEQFHYLYAYSPYHRVVEGTQYPAIMFDTGDADTRVDPLHARKMCALMQYVTGSDRPVLLHYDALLGHSGGRAVSRYVADLATTLGFLMWQVGLPLALQDGHAGGLGDGE